MRSTDWNYTLRSLWKDRGFAATVVLTLAVGIGADTAIFSVVDGILLRPLDYKQPERLASIVQQSSKFLNHTAELPINIAQLVEWQKEVKSFEGISMFRSGAFNLTGSGNPELINGAVVSANLFRLLGIAPQLGRSFADDEDLAGKDNVCVISDSLWRRRFSADSGIAGKQVTLSGRTYSIVGVLPPGFEFPRLGETGPRFGDQLEIFKPIGYRADDTVFSMGDFNYWTAVRIREGVTFERASQELNAVQAAMSARVKSETPLDETLRPLQEQMTGQVRKGLVVLMSAVGAVLLILCVNLANLALSRSVGRARDSAIRTALGASRGRLVRSAFLESAVLAGIGGALGIALAILGLRGLLAIAPLDIPRLADVRLDARVLLFALAISALTSFLFGALPALRAAASKSPVDALKAGRSQTDGKSGSLLRNTLVGAEVAMSAALLVTAGLLIASFAHLMTIDKGFDVSRVITVRVPLPYNKYTKDEQRIEFADRLVEKAQALPGVESVVLTSATPLQGETWIDMVSRDHDTRRVSELPSANIRFVTSGYFKTMRMPLRAGRDFDNHDRGRDVAVISSSLAQNLYPGQNAIGRKVHDHGKDFDIVGITVDARSTSLDKNPPHMLYVPYWLRPQWGGVLLVRTAMEPTGIANALRRVVWSLDSEVPVPEERTLEDILDRSVAQRRFQTTLMMLFAAGALALAIFGAYGVVSYGVARRQSEIGIRMALGASRGNVLGMVLRQAMTPVVIGLGIGVVAAMWIARLVASLLFGISPHDPAAFAAASIALAGAALAACMVPARRATRINPIDALRNE